MSLKKKINVQQRKLAIQGAEFKALLDDGETSVNRHAVAMGILTSAFATGFLFQRLSPGGRLPVSVRRIALTSLLPL